MHLFCHGWRSLEGTLVLLAAFSLLPPAAIAQQPDASKTLPPSVVETTRKQIRDYLGTVDPKGIPLLDARIDWDIPANWPDQFVFKGCRFNLDIRDLSTNGFRQLKSRTEIKPTMKVNFWYLVSPSGPNAVDPNTISPRAIWIPGKRVADKQLMWGGWGEVGEAARNIFEYTYYPSGTLFRARFDPRAPQAATYWVFDSNGKLAACTRGTNYFWADRPAKRWAFWRWSDELYAKQGIVSKVAGDTYSVPHTYQRPNAPGTPAR